MNDIIDISSLRLNEGYFLVKPDIKTKPFVGENEKDEFYSHCYTYQKSKPIIKNNVLELIRKAKRKIFIVSFRIGEKELLEALYEAVDRLRGGIYVITALDEKSLARGLKEVEDETEIDEQAQKKQFSEMIRRGIYIRGHSSCHAKFIIIDDQIALVSSANLETRAFEITGENGAIIYDQSEVERLARFFTRIWYNGCEWELAPGQGYTVHKREKTNCPCTINFPNIDTGQRVIWTYDQENNILETIHDVLKKAKRSVVMSTFGLINMTTRPDLLLEPLQKAIQEKKLKVSILMRARNHLKQTLMDAFTLAKMGVRVFADSLNHSKGIIADEGQYGALFSANFDANHGLINGVEVGVRLDGSNALKEALNYFEHSMKYSDCEFIVQPTQQEMSQRLIGKWKEPWPLEEKIMVHSEDNEWNKFNTEVPKGPVLFDIEENEKFNLYAGNTTWRLESPINNEKYHLKYKGKNPTKSSSKLLEKWMYSFGSNRSQQSITKGVCSTVFKKINN